MLAVSCTRRPRTDPSAASTHPHLAHKQSHSPRRGQQQQQHLINGAAQQQQLSPRVEWLTKVRAA
jgi:hypothetical protein